jgi:predicted AAA+ superfamily ATPase
MLQRIAVGIERLLPEPTPPADVKSADAYLWDGQAKTLLPVAFPQQVDISSLKGIDAARDALLANTSQFAKGFSANHAVLWGAPGMGKSALVKAVWAQVNRETPHSIVLIEIARSELATLPQLVQLLRGWVIRRFIVFCDDLPLEACAPLSALEGGIEARPDHILCYATTGQPGQSSDGTSPLPGLFGLSLHFLPCQQTQYLAIAQAYAERYKLGIPAEELDRQAVEWAAARNARSGRVAWQFIQDLAGRIGKRLG